MANNATRRVHNFVVALFFAAAMGDLSQTTLQAADNNVAAQGTIDIGSRRELFVDHFLVDRLTGATLELQEPKVAETSINFMERAWEGSWSSYVTVLKDGDRYRMYYSGHPTRVGKDDSSECYAESPDGIRWTRPNLGQVEINGSKNNNVLNVPDRSFEGLGAPFVDPRPGTPASMKFKAVGGSIKTGLFVMVSSDGLNWKKFSTKPFLPPLEMPPNNVPPTDYDGMNQIFYSESEGVYVCLYRHWVKASLPKPNDAYPGGWYRWVGRTTSKDLVHWSKPVEMDTGGLPIEHWYFNSTAPYFRAPHIYIGTPPHYMPDLAHPDFVNNPTDGHSTRSESRFVSSRGGTHYDRTFGQDRWIKTGLPNTDFFFPNQSNWPVFAGRLGLNVVPTGAKEMSIYLEQAGRVVRYTLRTDGFVALAAGAGGGEMISKPLKFTGDTLTLNYLTAPGGTVAVEITDVAERPLPGYALADAIPLVGDEIEKVVTWKNGSDVGKLASRPVRLRLVLKSAKVFSLQFSVPHGTSLRSGSPSDSRSDK